MALFSQVDQNLNGHDLHVFLGAACQVFLLSRHHDLEVILFPPVVFQIVFQVVADCLSYIFKLWLLRQVTGCAHKLTQEAHGLQYVSEFDGALILKHIQKVGQHHTFSKDALYFVKHLIALLLYLGAPFEHTAIDKTHANRSYLIDKGFGH